MISVLTDGGSIAFILDCVDKMNHKKMNVNQFDKFVDELREIARKNNCCIGFSSKKGDENGKS